MMCMAKSKIVTSSLSPGDGAQVVFNVCMAHDCLVC